MIDFQHLQFGAHCGALGHRTPEIHRVFMVDEREDQEEPSHDSLANQPEASASGGDAQTANLMRLVVELGSTTPNRTRWKVSVQRTKFSRIS